MVSVRLEDCRHKLGQNGFFIVQGVDDDGDDDGDDNDTGGDADYIIESKCLNFCLRSVSALHF